MRVLSGVCSQMCAFSCVVYTRALAHRWCALYTLRAFIAVWCAHVDRCIAHSCGMNRHMFGLICLLTEVCPHSYVISRLVRNLVKSMAEAAWSEDGRVS